MTSSNGNIIRASVPFCGEYSPVTGGFPSQRDNNADLWCFFVVSLNKLLNKHSIDRLFETPSPPFSVAVMRHVNCLQK